jgi:hypothetical protein
MAQKLADDYERSVRSALKSGAGEAGATRTVEAYPNQEGPPRPLVFQLELPRTDGFVDLDVLYKHLNFAAFGGRKPSA